MLKRTAAILLLSVLLFNWVGYKLLTTFWEEHAAKSLEANLDHDEYDSNLLVTLRVPADVLPYTNCSREFRRAHGLIAIGEARYRVVKKRLFNDSVEYICVLDGTASRLNSADNEFFSLVNDLQKDTPAKSPSQNNKTIHSFFKILCFSTSQFPDLTSFVRHPVRLPAYRQALLPAGHPRLGLRPPRNAGALS